MIRKKYIHRFRRKFSPVGGYLLPVVIALGLGISTISVFALQTLTNNSTRLNNQQYSSIAREAAKAGIKAATACIQSSNQTDRSWAGNELITTNCAGVANPAVGTGNKVVDVPGSYFSTYAVDSPVYGDDNSVTISDAGNHTVLINATGTVTIFGAGGAAKGHITEKVRAFAVLGIKRNVVQVSTGPNSACAIATEADGQSTWPYCWGNNSSNQLGQGTNAASFYTSPTAVSGRRNGVTTMTVTTNAGRVCVGPWNNISLFFSGGVFGYCPWPNTWSYTGPSINQVTVPNALQNADGTWKQITKVSVGTNHSCAIAKDTISSTQSKAYCWGDNIAGEQGTRDFYNYPIPVNVDTRSAWTTTTANSICDGTQIYVPVGFTFVPYPPFLTETPGYWTCIAGPMQVGWTGSATFDNEASALHDNTVSTAPQDTTSRNVLDISAADNYTCTLSAQTAGTVAQQAQSRFAQCWGKNDNGELGVSDRAYRNIPTSVTTHPPIAYVAPWQTCDSPNVYTPPVYTPAIYIPPVYIWIPFVGNILLYPGYWQPPILIIAEQCLYNPFGGNPAGWTYHPGNPAYAGSILYGKTITAIAEVNGGDTMCVLAVNSNNANASDPNYHKGKAYCWGMGYGGQLGNGAASSNASVSQSCGLGYPAAPAIDTSNDALEPVAVSSALTFDSLAVVGSANSEYVVAKVASDSPTDANKLYSWGGSTATIQSRSSGICTTTRTYTAQPTPQPVYSGTTGLLNGNSTFKGEINDGNGHTGRGFSGNPLTGLFCGINSGNDNVYCDTLGSGSGTTAGQQLMPQGYADLMAAGKQVVAIDVGGTGNNNFACAITKLGTDDGVVGCWGKNDQGQLGVGDTVDRNVPTPVSISTVYGIDVSSTTYKLEKIVYF